jgi:hypothetical protein
MFLERIGTYVTEIFLPAVSHVDVLDMISALTCA